MYQKNRKQMACALFVYLLLILLHVSCSNTIEHGEINGRETILNGEETRSNEEETKEILNRETEIPEVFETFFRYIFENNVSALKQNAKVYFIEIEDKDPSSDFLARFNGHSPPVKKGSGYKEDGNSLLFRIDRYTWIDDNTVEIRGGYNEGPLSASWANYTWERKNSKWTLKSVGLMMVA